MKHIMGIEYGRGATAVVVVNGGPALAPAAVKKMYPNFDCQFCAVFLFYICVFLCIMLANATISRFFIWVILFSNGFSIIIEYNSSKYF